MEVVIQQIQKQLGSISISNQDLCGTDLTQIKIETRIGVKNRFICSENEFASDLGVHAAEKIFKSGMERDSIDFLVYCTQSPDFQMPTTACQIHHALGLKESCGAIDINQGCSGWIYGLGLADSLVRNQRAKKVLLICSDSYSKSISDSDLSNRAIFGDAGTATIISDLKGVESYLFKIHDNSFEFGTDGSGFDFLGVRNSGIKGSKINSSLEKKFHMNGVSVFDFCMKKIPPFRNKILIKTKIKEELIGKYVLHQASKTMLDALQKRMNIPDEKFVRCLEGFGNTVSSTIPISLISSLEMEAFKKNELIMCIGFGIGMSWSGCILKK